MNLVLPIARGTGWLAAAFLPALAYAAAQATLAIDAGTARFWFALGAVQGVGLFGWAVSSLADVAQWKDDSGGAVEIAARRLKILQGILTSIFAANIAYYGGLYYLGAAEIASFLAAGIAAFGGDKFLSPLLSRITGKAVNPGG